MTLITFWVSKGFKNILRMLYQSMLFLLPAECDEVLNLQERVAQEQAHKAPALRYVRQEGVGPELLRHLHYHYHYYLY